MSPDHIGPLSGPAPAPGDDRAPDEAVLARRFAECYGAAPAAPMELVRIAARILASPVSCSDTLLLVADAFRDCSQFVGPDMRKRHIGALATHLANEAPLRARRCRS